MGPMHERSSSVPASLLVALDPALGDMDHSTATSTGTTAAVPATLLDAQASSSNAFPRPSIPPRPYTPVHSSSARSVTDQPYAYVVHSPPASPSASSSHPEGAPRSGPYLSLPSAQKDTSLLSPSAHWVSESDLTTLFAPSSPSASSVPDMDEKASFFVGVSKDDDDGIYIDRPPELDKLNEEQQAIAAEYAPDLDSEQKSLVRTLLSTALDWRKYVRWQYWRTSPTNPDLYLITVTIVALIIVITVFHHTLVQDLKPASEKVRHLAWGWIIPVLLLFVLSFPPLFGGEIIAVLCGLVYGVWIGFGIVALGTLLGEIANFLLFRHMLQAAASKMERKNLTYACLAEIIRTGGFVVALLARFSAIPGHLTTAVFSTVGMRFWVFFLSALLSLPKHLSVVYLGVALDTENEEKHSGGSKGVQIGVIIGVAAITIAIALYLWRKMDQVKPHVQRSMQLERFQRLHAAASASEKLNTPSTTSVNMIDEKETGPVPVSL